MRSGATWLGTSLRVDTGDTAGTSNSYYPIISSEGSNVYIVWEEYRNGNSDPYFNVYGNPDMHIKFMGVNIPNGASLNGGKLRVNQFVGREFAIAIKNYGSEDLNLTGSPDMVTLSGPEAKYFKVIQQPASSTISPGGSTIFKLRTKITTAPPLPKGWVMNIDFTVNIPNNDPDENPYTFDVGFKAKK